MTAIPGTIVAAPLSPGDTSVSLPTHDALYGKGGRREVADITERDAIPSDRLTAGCTVWVESVQIEYRWTGAVYVVHSTGSSSSSPMQFIFGEEETGDDSIVVPGPRGEQGATGATGAPGGTGPQGDPGPQGNPGDPGADGADGADGAAGRDGLALFLLNDLEPEEPLMVPGPKGDTGATGATGAPGSGGGNTILLPGDGDGEGGGDTFFMAATREQITSFGGYLQWIEITGATTAEDGKGYICNHASTRVVITLPASAPLGFKFAVIGKGAAGWKIAQNASQKIIFDQINVTVTGTAGYVQSPANYRAGMELVCVVTNTDWQSRALDAFTPGNGYGYAASGATNSAQTTGTAAIAAYNLAADTCAAISATLTTADNYGFGVSSQSAGYVLGGEIVTGGTYFDRIEKLAYTTEATSVLAAVMPTVIDVGASCWLATDSGWTMGGWIAARTTAIYKLTYSSEATSTASGTLNTAKYAQIGTSAPTKGYCYGGFSAAPANVAVIEDLIFSTGASAALAATLDTAKRECGSTQSTLKGFIMGGFTSAAVAVIEDMTYAGETSVALAATLDTARNRNSAGFQHATKGYTAGGNVSTGIENITFASEASVAESATLPTAVGGAQGLCP